MSTGLRAFFAVLTLITTLAVFAGALFGFFGHDNSGNHMYGLGIVGVLLTALFSVFVYHDAQFFFGKKAAPAPVPAPVAAEPHAPAATPETK
jgi:hypothetical protein